MQVQKGHIKQHQSTPQHPREVTIREVESERIDDDAAGMLELPELAPASSLLGKEAETGVRQGAGEEGSVWRPAMVCFQAV